MPNWCSCSVEIDCSKELFDEIYTYVKSENNIFDFGRIIPMPESLHIDSGSMTDRAIAYTITERLTIPVEQTNLSELITNQFDPDWDNKVAAAVATWAETASAEDKNNLYAQGKQYLFNKENYGAFTWYEWSIENWGTKWNAEDASLNQNTFCFDTAWSPCSPVIRALAERFPEAHIRFQYSEPGWGFCGVEEYKNGCLVYKLDGDYYEIWPEDNEVGTRTNIDEDVLPISDKNIDYCLKEEKTVKIMRTGKLYYREKMADEYVTEIIANVFFVGAPPQNFWN